ncbi:lipopolysaccharide biosynthesis protein [Geodermatophilus sp. SYSU D00758]
MTSVSDGAPPEVAAGPAPAGGRLRPLLRGLQLPIWSVVQMAVQMAVALLSARLLGPADRGDLVLATTIATLMLLVSSLGAGQASRVVLAEPGRWWTWSRFVALSALLTVPHVLLSATVGLAVLFSLSTGDTALALPFVVYSATALGAHLLREGLHGLGRHRTTMAIDVASAGTQLLLIVGAHLAGVLSPATALYIGAACYAGSITTQVLVGRAADVEGRARPPVGVGEWWREARGFVGVSRFALVAALGQSFVVNGDRLVLGAAGSSAQVGIYAVASSLAQIAWVAPVALTPMLTRRTAAAGGLDPWRRMHLRVLALTGVLAVAVAVAGWFAIPFLLGDEFRPARDVLPVLCLAAIPYASYHVDSAACAGLRDLRTGALGALVGCVVLVAAATGGYRLLGTAGIAGGVVLTYVVMAATARWRMAGRLAAAVPGHRS